jgi:hypothetical protein
VHSLDLTARGRHITQNLWYDAGENEMKFPRASTQSKWKKMGKRDGLVRIRGDVTLVSLRFEINLISAPAAFGLLVLVEDLPG